MTRAAGAASAAENLASRLAEAERAEAGPRRKAQELEVALAAAVAAERFSDAERLKGELREARAGLALRAAEKAALRDGQAAVEREQQAAEQAIREAQQRREARDVINDAQVAERQALDAVDVALAEMRGHLDAARAACQTALNLEASVFDARSRAVQARHALGEFPPGHSGPKVSAPNKVAVLIDSDPVVRALMLRHA